MKRFRCTTLCISWSQTVAIVERVQEGMKVMKVFQILNLSKMSVYAMMIKFNKIQGMFRPGRINTSEACQCCQILNLEESKLEHKSDGEERSINRESMRFLVKKE